MRDVTSRLRHALCSAVAILLLSVLPALARGAELAGTWQEYDDASGKVEALIRVEQGADGAYSGTIVKLMADVVGSASRTCVACRGGLHNQPLLGMRIFYGMTRRDASTFEGGEIIDPESGKVYRCRMRLSEDGNTLEVTGFVGVSWLGETEIWRRAQ